MYCSKWLYIKENSVTNSKFQILNLLVMLPSDALRSYNTVLHVYIPTVFA